MTKLSLSMGPYLRALTFTGISLVVQLSLLFPSPFPAVKFPICFFDTLISLDYGICLLLKLRETGIQKKLEWDEYLSTEVRLAAILPWRVNLCYREDLVLSLWFLFSSPWQSHSRIFLGSWDKAHKSMPFLHFPVCNPQQVLPLLLDHTQLIVIHQDHLLCISTS